MFQSSLLDKCIDFHRGDNMSLVIILATFCILGFWWRRRPKWSAPGPIGLPLAGVAPMLAKNPHVTLTDWSKMYGSVMNVRVGREDWIVLTTAEAIKEAFVKQGQKFSSRPPNYFTDCVLSGGRNGILFNDGACWKKLKRFVMSAFHKLDSGGKFFENVINSEARCLIEKLNHHEGQILDLSPHFLGATANVISTILNGHREEYGTEEFSVLYNMIKKFVADPEKTKLANAIIFCPSLRYLPIFRSVVRQGQDDSKDLAEFMRSTMLQQESCSDREDHDCLMDIFQSKSYRGDYPDVFTDQNLIFVARDLFLAGTETTTVSLLWCVLSLVHDLKLQENIRKEIDESFQPSILKFTGHRSTMPLMFSFMEEIHRYCTVAPLALPHMTNQDASVGGYEIKNGTTVIVNLWGAHRNPMVFKNPHTFNPYRFINSDGKFAKSLDVMTFSMGYRSCLGEKLASVETFMFLSYILKNFILIPADEAKLPSLNDGILSTTYSPKPFKVIISRRS